MTQADVHASLALLFGELIEGPEGHESFMLNPGDPGMLRALDALSAEAASRVPGPGGASIAAHVDHVIYGLDLLLRWSDGEPNPWSTSDWSVSWTRGTVDEQEWAARRERFRTVARRWRTVLQSPRPLSAFELSGVMASIGHLAYHLGAIRQIDRTIQGPKAQKPGGASA